MLTETVAHGGERVVLVVSIPTHEEMLRGLMRRLADPGRKTLPKSTSYGVEWPIFGRKVPPGGEKSPQSRRDFERK